MRAARRKRTFPYVTGGVALAALGLLAGNYAGSRWHGGPPSISLGQNGLSASADPLDAGGENESVIQAQRKRIMGRMRSLEQISRVATRVRPLVDAALELPSVQDDVRALAVIAGKPIPDYKAYFAGKQEADLLLESGGDPNARSVADAIGVAQFMVGTGQKSGLRVDIGASNALSRKIGQIDRLMAALEATPPGWQKAAPLGMGGSWSRDQWLGYRKQQWNNLVAKRRKVDWRFDPGKSVIAQTKYLLRLTRRYSGIDWALQAYHGGEGGVTRTVGLFARSASYNVLASRGGASYGHWIPYSELYRRVNPVSTPAAFSYLFGRSDDHRYYWWKVLMAERALDLYRKDPTEFEKQWRALQPGMSADAAYYPNTPALQFADNGALQVGYRAQTLVPLPVNASRLGLRTDNLAVLEPTSGAIFKGLRPEAMGVLIRLAHLYKTHGGREPVSILAMVQTNTYRAKWSTRYPDRPLPPGIPRDPEFHTTGLCFDLKRPNDDWSRKVLEFSMGRLYDSLRISWRKENEAGSQRYHVVVNPQYKAEMIDYYEKALR